MHIPDRFIRPFPAPEEVFSAEIERHAKHFLPICSLNLQFIRPESEAFWVHFVQPAEIREGAVGEHTPETHDRFNFEDSIGFDVDENGKYRFNGDWQFFILEKDGMPPEKEAAIKKKAEKIVEKNHISMEKACHYLTPYVYRAETREKLEQVYRLNHLSYQAVKALYQKHGRFFCGYAPLESGGSYTRQEPEALKEKADQAAAGYEADTVILEDAGGLSQEMQKEMQESGLHHVDELFRQEYGNLYDTPKRADGRVFSYIGWLNGNKFQEYGCDELYLFFDENSKKAVIRLVYS